ncbi:MAG: DUF3817 domain-containing protein [Spirochaetota bacterium]
MSDSVAKKNIDQKFLKGLRILSLTEGVSTLILFLIAMPLKYLAGYPLAVTIVGSLHGGLFVLLIVLAALAIVKVPIGLPLGIATMVAAVVPGGPFVVDHWLKKLQ